MENKTMKKIKIDLSKGNFGERKSYKKSDVVVCNYKGIDQEPLMSIVHRCEEETASISNKNGIESYSVYWLRLATPSEKKLLGTRYFAEIEDISQVKEVKQKIEEKPQSYTNMIAENLKTIEQKDKKINNLEIELEVYVNHSKFLENQTAKQSIEIRELEAEIRSLKDRIDANNKHTLQLLDTQKTSKTFYI
jgi:hypothetical protein